MQNNIEKILTKEKLYAIYKRGALGQKSQDRLKARIEEAYPWLIKAMAKYEINTPIRIAAFLAQIGHESGALKFRKEIWGPTPAQLRYEFRRDLGNLRPGDGERYKGRGYIQVTGFLNYKRIASALNIDCVRNPSLLETVEYSALTAAYFWHANKLNAFADALLTNDKAFERLTRAINGGLNGLPDRLGYFQDALEVFEITG
jgi:putative chitinase